MPEGQKALQVGGPIRGALDLEFGTSCCFRKIERRWRHAPQPTMSKLGWGGRGGAYKDVTFVTFGLILQGLGVAPHTHNDRFHELQSDGVRGWP